MTILLKLVSAMGSRQCLCYCYKRSNVPNNHAVIFKRNIRRRTEKKVQLTPEIVYETPRAGNMFPGLMKCIGFTALTCGSAFAIAAIYQHEKIKKDRSKQFFKKLFEEKWNEAGGYENKHGSLRQHLNRWWNELSIGEKTFWGICSANIVVFLCWHHPSLRPVMMRYFTSSPAARAVCWPMFLSTFSHYSPIHLFVNMFVLHSFIAGTHNHLGMEQFLAFYCSGGLVASLSSLTHKVLAGLTGPSIGASGAIMALLAYFCSKYPDAQLGIIFIPGISFSADSAIKGIMMLDAAGLIFRWTIFDHAGHLGGALFGLFYSHFGQQFLWGKREYIIKYWSGFKDKYDEIRNRRL